VIPTAVKSLGDDVELRIGWATWDEGNFKERSIKFCYRKNGRIPRTAPEVPIDRLVDMVVFALREKELGPEGVRRLKAALR